MKSIFKKVSKHLSVRLFLNIVVWVLVVAEAAISNIPDDPKNYLVVYTGKVVSIVSLFVFTYFNNLYLVPKFLVKKKRGIYFPVIITTVIFYALAYTIFVKACLNVNHNIHSYDVEVLAIPVSSKWSFISILGSTLGYVFTWGLWALIFTMAWYMNDYSRQQKAMVLVQQKQVETELSFLKSQINPHFLFNTLNNLYALALKKSDTTPDAILKLSAILRYLLYESNTPTVSFDKEKEIMEAYIDLELLRLTDKNDLHFTITADKPYNLPPLLWLPILENVFKHGTRTMSGNNMVDYHFEIKDDQLYISSKNNEKLLAKSTNEPGGIGLTNLQKRLEILYPHKYSLSKRHENNCYISEVKIDLA